MVRTTTKKSLPKTRSTRTFYGHLCIYSIRKILPNLSNTHNFLLSITETIFMYKDRFVSLRRTIWVPTCLCCASQVEKTGKIAFLDKNIRLLVLYDLAWPLPCYLHIIIIHKIVSIESHYHITIKQYFLHYRPSHSAGMLKMWGPIRAGASNVLCVWPWPRLFHNSTSVPPRKTKVLFLLFISMIVDYTGYIFSRIYFDIWISAGIIHICGVLVLLLSKKFIV